MRRETSDRHMLTGVPSLSKLSKKYFTDSPCEDDKEQRESVRLSKHCELTIKTAEHKLDIQTAVQKVNNLPFFIFGFIHTTKVCYLVFMTKRVLGLNVLK